MVRSKDCMISFLKRHRSRLNYLGVTSKIQYVYFWPIARMSQQYTDPFYLFVLDFCRVHSRILTSQTTDQLRAHFICSLENNWRQICSILFILHRTVTCALRDSQFSNSQVCIPERPQFYEFEVTMGRNVSWGQKILLSLANRPKMFKIIFLTTMYQPKEKMLRLAQWNFYKGQPLTK